MEAEEKEADRLLTDAGLNNEKPAYSEAAMRWKARREIPMPPDGLDTQANDSGVGERVAFLLDLLEGLSTANVILLTLKMCGFTVGEISQQICESPAQIHNDLKRLRKNIRSQLERMGYSKT